MQYRFCSFADARQSHHHVSADLLHLEREVGDGLLKFGALLTRQGQLVTQSSVTGHDAPAARTARRLAQTETRSNSGQIALNTKLTRYRAYYQCRPAVSQKNGPNK